MNEKIYLMEMQHRTDEHETDRMIACSSTCHVWRQHAACTLCGRGKDL